MDNRLFGQSTVRGRDIIEFHDTAGRTVREIITLQALTFVDHALYAENVNKNMSPCSFVNTNIPIYYAYINVLYSRTRALKGKISKNYHNSMSVNNIFA